MTRSQDIEVMIAAIRRLMAAPATAVRFHFGMSEMRLFSALYGRPVVAEIMGSEDEDEDGALAKTGFTPVYDEPWYHPYDSVTNKAWFDDLDPVQIAKVCRTALRLLNSKEDGSVSVTDEAIPELDALHTFLARQEATLWYHDRNSTVPPPYVIFCANFDPYQGFVHEADVVLGQLSYMASYGLPGELARDAFRPYRNLMSDLYDDGWQREYPHGFPWDAYISHSDMEQHLPVSYGFWWDAAHAGIPGAGYGLGSPASGEFLVVDNEETLEEIRRHFQGKYLIVELDERDFVGGPYGIPEEYIDMVRRTGATRIEGGVVQPLLSDPGA